MSKLIKRVPRLIKLESKGDITTDSEETEIYKEKLKNLYANKCENLRKKRISRYSKFSRYIQFTNAKSRWSIWFIFFYILLDIFLVAFQYILEWNLFLSRFLSLTDSDKSSSPSSNFLGSFSVNLFGFTFQMYLQLFCFQIKPFLQVTGIRTKHIFFWRFNLQFSKCWYESLQILAFVNKTVRKIYGKVQSLVLGKSPELHGCIWYLFDLVSNCRTVCKLWICFLLHHVDMSSFSPSILGCFSSPVVPGVYSTVVPPCGFNLHITNA